MPHYAALEPTTHTHPVAADPAVTDQFAAPLPGDGDDVAALRPLLAQTQLESAPLRMAYDADEDGWTPDAFHAAVDSFGAALVVAQTGAGGYHGGHMWQKGLACRRSCCSPPLDGRTGSSSSQFSRKAQRRYLRAHRPCLFPVLTEGGALVGGYNARGWVSLCEDRDSPASFLYAWRDGDVSQRPLKLPKVSKALSSWVRVCVCVLCVWGGGGGGQQLGQRGHRPVARLADAELPSPSSTLTPHPVRLPTGGRPRPGGGARRSGAGPLLWARRAAHPAGTWERAASKVQAWAVLFAVRGCRLCWLGAADAAPVAACEPGQSRCHLQRPEQAGSLLRLPTRSHLAALCPHPSPASLPDGGKCLFAAGESGKGVQLMGLRAYVAEGRGACTVGGGGICARM